MVNGVFSFVATVSWALSAAFMFTLGAGCGGYMASVQVTNLVLLVECLDHHPSSRLLGVSLNGWSFSMQIWVVESCRWLASVHRSAEARSMALRVVSHRSDVVDSMRGFSEPALSVSNAKVLSERYSYADLFRYGLGFSSRDFDFRGSQCSRGGLPG
ncbi:hypothetical protein COOONC_26947 [Cooperia oncophora]